MAETYAQAIAKAKARYKEAMDDAAADALVIAEKYGKPLAAICNQIAGDEGQALRFRAARLAKRAGQSAEAMTRAREAENRRKALAHAKVVLKDPEQAAKVIAALPPQALDDVYHEARLARAGASELP